MIYGVVKTRIKAGTFGWVKPGTLDLEPSDRPTFVALQDLEVGDAIMLVPTLDYRITQQGQGQIITTKG